MPKARLDIGFKKLTVMGQQKGTRRPRVKSWCQVSQSQHLITRRTRPSSGARRTDNSLAPSVSLHCHDTRRYPLNGLWLGAPANPFRALQSPKTSELSATGQAGHF